MHVHHMTIFDRNSTCGSDMTTFGRNKQFKALLLLYNNCFNHHYYHSQTVLTKQQNGPLLSEILLNLMK